MVNHRGSVVRSFDPETPVPDDLVLLRNVAAPFDAFAEISFNPFLQIMQIVVLPDGIQRGIADDHMAHMAAQKRLDPEVVIERAIGDFDPATLGIGQMRWTVAMRTESQMVLRVVLYRWHSSRSEFRC